MKTKMYRLALIVFALFFFFSCEDKINREDMYTFKGQTAVDYINATPDLSLFSKVIARSYNTKRGNPSPVKSLLATRGHYTIFAPTDDAIRLYLDSVYGTKNYDVDTMSREVADKIVLNTVMDNSWEKPMKTLDLYEGALNESTLNDGHIVVHYGNYAPGVYIKMNNESCIIKGDIEVSNGYIHIIDRVLPPTPSSIAGLIAQAPNLTIFSMLLEETAWADSIALYEDKSYRDTVFFEQYEKLYGYRPQTSESYKIPRHRLYGYTVFPETDDVFQKDWNIPAPQIDEETNAITNKDRILESITEKCKQVYRECNGTDPKKEDNALNRFVSYHIIEGKYRYNYLAPNDQVLGHSVEKGIVNGFPAECPYKKSVSFDYFATMGNPGRLMKISFVNSSYKQINRHSFLDPSYAGTNQEIICLREGANILPNNNSYENYAVNGYYYPVNHVLVYDDFVTNSVLNERIRYPFSNILPEAINLLKGEYINPSNWRELSGALRYPNMYFKNTRVKKTQKIVNSGSCHLRYMSIQPQSDEFTFKLLPVPFEGNWQIRIANLQGLINVYIANSPNKMRLLAGPNINRTSGGYRLPLELNNQYSGLMRNLIEEGDTIFKIENQLQAKKHGIMYLPCSLGSYNSLDIFGECYDYDVWCPWRAFVHGGYGRVIIYTGYFHPDKDYYIKLVNLQDSNDKGLTSTDTPFLFLDGSMIEMVPESIYGYHSTNEDWW